MSLRPIETAGTETRLLAAFLHGKDGI